MSYITIDGLTVRDGNSDVDANIHTGLAYCIDITIKNCIVERGVHSGIHCNGSTSATSYIIENNIIRNNGGFGILVDNNFDYGRINNNRIHGNGWRSAVDEVYYSGIQGYLGNNEIYSNNIYDNAPGTAHSAIACHGIYGLASEDTVNIYKNIVNNNLNGGGIKSRGTANIYQNIVYQNGTSGIDIGGNGALNVVYNINYNLILWNDKGASGFLGIYEGDKGAGTIALNIYNNTIFKNSGVSGYEVNIDDDLTSLLIRNNILNTSSTRRTIRIVAQSGTFVINYNLHWRDDGNAYPTYNGGSNSWAEWQGLTYDVNGINTDPMFDVSAGFSLQSISPAIGTGTDVGLLHDCSDHTLTGTPDIGAFEYKGLYYNSIKNIAHTATNAGTELGVIVPGNAFYNSYFSECRICMLFAYCKCFYYWYSYYWKSRGKWV